MWNSAVSDDQWALLKGQVMSSFFFFSTLSLIKAGSLLCVSERQARLNLDGEKSWRLLFSPLRQSPSSWMHVLQVVLLKAGVVINIYTAEGQILGVVWSPWQLCEVKTHRKALRSEWPLRILLCCTAIKPCYKFNLQWKKGAQLWHLSTEGHELIN